MGWDLTDGDKGGLLMTLGGILEFFLGNTFSFVVFCSFGTSATLPPNQAHLVPELIVERGFLVHTREYLDTGL